MSGEDVDIKPGNAMPLGNMPIGTIVHNVEIKIGKGGQMARSAGKHAREAKEGIATFKEEFDHGMGEDNPLNEIVDTVRSAHPREMVKKAVSTPAEKKPPTQPQ